MEEVGTFEEVYLANEIDGYEIGNEKTLNQFRNIKIILRFFFKGQLLIHQIWNQTSHLWE